MAGRVAPRSWLAIAAVMCNAWAPPAPTAAMVPPAPRAPPTKPEPYGFSFTPAGLAMTYHLGVAQGLLDAGLIDPTVPLAGASGGALAAFAVSLQPDAPGGIGMNSMLDSVLRANGACRSNGAFRNLRNALDEQLDILFNANEYCVINDDGSISCELVDYLNSRPASLRIAVTQLSPLPRGLLVDSFETLDDLKQSFLATCCIPFYFAKTPTVMFRGLPAVDGFFASPREVFGAPDTTAELTIRVCPFPGVLQAGRYVICPERDDMNPEELTSLFQAALGSPVAEDSVLMDLFEQGLTDSSTWVKTYGDVAKKH